MVERRNRRLSEAKLGSKRSMIGMEASAVRQEGALPTAGDATRIMRRRSAKARRVAIEAGLARSHPIALATRGKDSRAGGGGNTKPILVRFDEVRTEALRHSDLTVEKNAIGQQLLTLDTSNNYDS